MVAGLLIGRTSKNRITELSSYANMLPLKSSSTLASSNLGGCGRYAGHHLGWPGQPELAADLHAKVERLDVGGCA